MLTTRLGVRVSWRYVGEVLVQSSVFVRIVGLTDRHLAARRVVVHIEV